MRPLAAPYLCLAAFVAGCASKVAATTTDAAIDAPSDVVAPIDAPPDAPDAPVDVVADRRVPRDAPPDDVDQTCAAGLTDQCLGRPPGPCPDLSDGMDHVLRFDGFAHDYPVSCAGRMTGAGPDGVIPLTITQTSDVDVSAVPGTGDAVVVSLYPVDQCGEPASELECINGSNSIGGIATFRASSLPPGRYAMLVATARGAETHVRAQVTPARVRLPGDLCPGVAVVPDGAEATIDTLRYLSIADYGTSCGYGSGMGLGWVDAVFSYTITATRDVTVEVNGDGMEDLHVELSTVCGSRSQNLPGCDVGLPARHVVHNQPPGTYYGVVDYLPTRRPDHQVRVRVTTSAPTPPGPAATCPGLPLDPGRGATVDADTLTPGPMLACITGQRATGFWRFIAPADGRDVMVNVATDAMRGDAALMVREACDGAMVNDCVGPLDRTAPSVWSRLRGLRPGVSYVLQGTTSAAGGTLSAAWQATTAATPQAVTGNTTCAAAATIPPTGGIFTGSNATATAVINPVCANSTSGCMGSRGALYHLTLPSMRRVVATLTSATFDTLLAINSGDTCPGRPVFTACNDDWYSTNASVSAVLPAGSYWIHAGGCGPMQSGDYQLDVAVLDP